MAKAKRTDAKSMIERKYSKKVDKLLKEYWDKPMGELWKALDELKAKMKIELEEKGLDGKGDIVDR